MSLGHFGVKLHGSDDAGASWTRGRRAGLSRRKPQDGDGPARGRSSRSGRSRRCSAATRALLGRHAAGRPVPLRRPRRDLAAGRVAVGPRRSGRSGSAAATTCPGIHSICRRSARRRDVLRRRLAAAACGARDDGGEHWELRGEGMRAEYMPPEQARQPEHPGPAPIVALRRPRPDALWAQHHNGIFRSTDGGASWQRDRPARAVGLRLRGGGRIRATRDTAWFVPAVKDECARAGRRRAGGHPHARRRRSFEALRDGLPQEHCYDLVYRHGLAVDDDGATPGVRLDDRLVVDHGRPGRPLDRGVPGCRRSTRCVSSELSTGRSATPTHEIDPTRRPPRIGLCPAAGGAPLSKGLSPDEEQSLRTVPRLAKAGPPCKAAG